MKSKTIINFNLLIDKAKIDSNKTHCPGQVDYDVSPMILFFQGQVWLCFRSLDYFH